jgi:DNA-binding CsgD family transcriptional regulator
MRLAVDTGWDSERLNSLAALAKVEAVTGRADEARAHAREVVAVGEQTGAWAYVGSARTALGLAELSLGNYAAAIEPLREVADFTAESGLTNSPMMWWSSDLVECYVQEGRLEEATLELKRLEESVERSGVPTAAAVAARCRALLAPDDFEKHLDESMRWHARSGMAFEQARTELLFGSQLRRRRGRPEARLLLEAALGRFELLGALDWAERTRVELDALGVRRARPQAGLGQLTPQELQVALAVAKGLSNREVAAQLFLSVKTVEFHLANVFHKLGINRRTRLATLVARQD